MPLKSIKTKCFICHILLVIKNKLFGLLVITRSPSTLFQLYYGSHNF